MLYAMSTSWFSIQVSIQNVGGGNTSVSYYFSVNNSTNLITGFYSYNNLNVNTLFSVPPSLPYFTTDFVDPGESPPWYAPADNLFDRTNLLFSVGINFSDTFLQTKPIQYEDTQSTPHTLNYPFFSFYSFDIGDGLTNYLWALDGPDITYSNNNVLTNSIVITPISGPPPYSIPVAPTIDNVNTRSILPGTVRLAVLDSSNGALNSVSYQYNYRNELFFTFQAVGTIDATSSNIGLAISSPGTQRLAVVTNIDTNYKLHYYRIINNTWGTPVKPTAINFNINPNGNVCIACAMTPNARRLIISAGNFGLLDNWIYWADASGLLAGTSTTLNFTRINDTLQHAFMVASVTPDGDRFIVSSFGGFVYYSNWNNTTGNYGPLIATGDIQRNYIGVYISPDKNKILYAANKKIYWSIWNGTNYPSGTATLDVSATEIRSVSLYGYGTTYEAVISVPLQANAQYAYWNGSSYDPWLIIPSTVIPSVFYGWGLTLDSSDNIYVAPYLAVQVFFARLSISGIYNPYINSGVTYTGTAPNNRYLFNVTGLNSNVPYVFNIRAQNPLGSSSFVTTRSISVFGDIPVISSVAPILNTPNKLRVNFSQPYKGTTPVSYFYSLASNGSNSISVTDVSFITADISQNVTIYVLASNNAGTLISNGVSGTPYFLGSVPTFTLSPLLNLSGVVRLTYSQTTTGTTPVTYFYSTSATGNPRTELTSNPTDISGLTGTTTYYVIANNLAGNVISNSVSITPYLLGSKPIISNIIANEGNEVSVVFSQTSVGIGPPIYYYSFDGIVVRTDASATVSPLIIKGLTNITSPYSISLFARNEAGDISSNVYPNVYVRGTNPTIDTITKSIGNSITVTFTQSQKGSDITIYYYSLNGSTVLTDASSLSSPLVISNLTNTATPYDIYVVARNPAGDVYSNATSNITIFGTRPTIDSITPNIGNSVTVAFTQSQKGTDQTIYYYSFNGTTVLTDASSLSSPLIIPNLTNTVTPYDIYVVASNPAGDISSNVVSNVSVLGTKPVIDSITQNVGNSITVAFTQSQKGTDNTIYYYSLNGTTVLTDASSTGGTITIPNLTNTAPYDIYVVASNPAGDVFSDPSTNIPVLGTKSVIDSITKNVGNSVTVAFTQSQKGTDPTVYYYSLNGTTVLTDASSTEGTLTIPNLTNTATLYNIYIVARNQAGDVYSDDVSNITIFGTNPTIDNITPNIGNSITVAFTQSQKGTDITTYYYSFNGSTVLLDASSLSSPLTISNLTNLTPYNIYVIARNPAGDLSSNVTSNVSVLGTIPTVNSITSNVGNTVTVDFAQSQKGTDTTVYYYSLNGTTVLTDASSLSSPLVISNLTDTNPYNIYVVARNPAGDLSSNVTSNVTIFGTRPTINSITPNIGNSVTVTFTQSQKGTDTTIYYYSFDGTTVLLDASSLSSPLVISNLTNTAIPYNIYVVARNPAGDLSSNLVSNVNVLGTRPTIDSITKNIGNSVTVEFTQSQKGTDQTIYYYSLNESTVLLDASSTGGPLTISNLTNTIPYNIYVVARNPAGDVSSNVSSNVSIFGTIPTINSVTPNVGNSVTVAFTQSQKGTDTTVYYYSLNGTTVLLDASSLSSPLVISNLTNTVTPYNIYVVARNPAGDLSSNVVSNVNVFGTRPTIDSITKNIENSITVAFTQSQKGTDQTIYYYSFNGTTVLTDASSTGGPLTISNLTNTTPYNIYVVARNPAGDLSSNVTSNVSVFGTRPSINSVTPNVGNSVTVDFAQSQKGTDQTVYYYSLNGSTVLLDASSTGGPLTISNLTDTATPYNIYVVARNPAGDLSSNVVSDVNVFGTRPTIDSITKNVGNSITVAFTQSQKGTDTTVYYYSFNGTTVLLDASSLSSPLTISNLTNLTTYNIYVIARNPAGDLSSNVTSNVTVLGTRPAINSVIPNIGNSITVAFTQLQKGTDNTIYYYSLNGTTVLTDASSTGGPLTISNLTNTIPYNIYVVARNPAGDVSSNVISNVNVFGTRPTINSITPNVGNSITVAFTQTQKGTDTTVYYYSFNGTTVLLDASSLSSPLVISNLTNTATPYNIYVIARNPAGDLSSNVTSNVTVLGTRPTIDSITKNVGNSITVAFTQSQKGTDNTIYYYSFNGTTVLLDASSTGGPLTISNLTNTIPYNIYVVARNPAGDVSSNVTSNVTVFGTRPTINSVTPNVGNSVTVAFTQSQKGTDTTVYYYSLNGTTVLLDASSLSSPLIISNLTNTATPYNIYLVARNPAGDLSSNVVSDVNVFGTRPTIDSITKNVGNSITVAFTQSQKGTDQTIYYYSFNGTTVLTDASSLSSPLTISNLTNTATPYNIYVVARNPAGDVSSNVTSNVSVFGTRPSINSVTPNVGNTVTVAFTQSQKGTDTTVYYYSFNGTTVLLDASSLSSPLVISNLTNTTPYNIYVVARNPAGDLSSNVVSNVNIFGTRPTIDSITKNVGNSITVAFTQTQKGTDTTVYYYSFNGTTVLTDASSLSSPLTISNLTNTATPYNIYVIARNPAGDVSSNLTSNVTVLGTRPAINSVTLNVGNSITVAFTQSQKGTDQTIYYYSLNGTTVLLDASSLSSPLTISNLTNTATPYNIYVVARNPAGDVSSNVVSDVNVFGTRPTINSITKNVGNSITVAFTQSQKGTDTTVYYYSFNGTTVLLDASSLSSPLTISNLTNTTPYNIYVIARNPAGDLSSNVTSNVSVFGTRPAINSVTSNVGNSVTVAFTQSKKGTNQTIYYYSLNGSTVLTDASSTGGLLTISNLNNTATPYNIYVVARNPAGDLSSNVVSNVSVFGTRPTINSITPNIGNSVTVAFTQSQKGTDNTIYYYSLNGTTVLLDASSTGGPITIANLTNTTPYNIYVIARNPAGDVSSNVVSNVNVFGTKPTIDSITKNIGNSITVTFTQSQKGTDTTVYYYSLNGSTVLTDASSTGGPLTISNLTNLTAYNIYVIARNPAGDLSSNVISNVTVLGTRPIINRVIPNIGNSVTVAFTQLQKGTDQTIYYYSLNGITVLTDASSTGGSLTIPNLTNLTPYNIYIIARNPAGDVFSNVYPNVYVLGIKPSVDNITKNIGNSINVSFTQSQKGSDVTTYYYSFNGTTVLRDASSLSSPLLISNLTNTTPYNIYVIAKNPAGDVSSNLISNVTVLGTRPTINSVTPNVGNSVTVAFTQSQKGTDQTIYYYSFNGTTILTDASSLSSPLVISNLTNTATPYNIYVVARNPAGDLSSNIISNVNVFGTRPTINSITKNVGNSVTVAFTQSQKGTDTTVYYYSFNGTTALIDASSTGGPITIANLTNTTPYNIYVIARNPAGDLSSNVTSNVSIFGTNPTINTITSNVGNSITVAFTQSQKGTDTTVYYYSFNGTTVLTDSSSLSSPLIISNLTNTATPYNIYLVARNPAGDLSSNVVSNVNVFGTRPTIDSITKNVGNSVTVAFTQTQKGTDQTIYYYSFNGTTVLTDVSSLSSPLTISNMTNLTPYNIYVVARNPAGDVSSNVTSNVSVFGTRPTINSVISNIGNSVTVAFTQSQKGTDQTIYYYSLNGTTVLTDASSLSSPLTISNLTNTVTPYNIYVIARNPAGDLSSNVTSNVNVFGTRPTINSVTPNVGNSVTVAFTQSQKGTDQTIYYYSFNGTTVLLDASSLSSPLTISNLTNTATSYNLYLVARNPAGDVSSNVISNVNVFGTRPTINSITKNVGNSVTVAFTQSQKGTDTTVYYYSFNGTTVLTDASSTGGPLTISNLTNLTAYNIYVIARNPAGDLSSNVTSNVTVLGTKPAINSVTPNVGNSVTVVFTQLQKGTDQTIYYYSFNGTTVLTDASSLSSPLVISNLTNTATPYNIYVVARNPAGDLSSNVISNVNVFGTRPTIDSVTRNVGNSITVAFTQSQKGTDTTVYYYSFNGTTVLTDVSSTGGPITIANLTNATPYNIYVIARNPAGDLSSNVTSNVSVFGTIPTINSVTPNIGNSVTVAFTQSQKGTDQTIYYYSLNGTTVLTDSSSQSSPLVISNLTNTATSYNIYVVARNPAGDLSSNVVSNVNVFGTRPTINSVTSNIGNSVTVAFTQSQKGTDNTIYYYSLNGSTVLTNVSSTGGSLTIPNLTNTVTPYNIYIVARNPAGDVSSNVYPNVYVRGTKPVINSITRNVGNKITVTFAQSQKGSDQTIYYYSFNGITVITDASSTGEPLTITNLTNIRVPYDIYVIARNPAGDIFSDPSTNVSVLGSKPVINSISLNVGNSITITFSQEQKGTDPTTYYYSFNGYIVLTDVSSYGPTLTISNLTDVSPYSIYLVARNGAGDVFSDPSTNIHILGTKPIINSITRNVGNSIIVNFTQVQKGSGVTTYYYSLNGSTVLMDASSTGGTLTIPNLTNTTPYSIYLVAVNPAGNVFSDPYTNVSVLGSKPVIKSITRNVGNTITVSFEQSQKGTDITIYNYSVDGSSVLVNASSLGTSLIIPNLTNPTPYNIYLVARNPAGDVFSDPSTNVHIFGTKPTINTITRNIGNSVTVSFAQSQKGTDTTSYYYSTDGSFVFISDSISQGSFTILNMTNRTPLYSIYVIARNPAGDLLSDISTNIGVFGTRPIINNVVQNIGNSVTVSFTQSQNGSDVTTYYGSIDGSTIISSAFSSGGSLTIPNLTNTAPYNIYVIARNPAGSLPSIPITGVNIFGTIPTINNIIRNIGNSITVDFDQSQKGTDTTVYYYSLNGSNVIMDASSLSSPLTISNLTNLTPYNIYIIARNPAGNLFSSVSANVDILGTRPIINSITKNIGNSLSISFTQSQKGTGVTTYYYSVNGSTVLTDASSSGNPFTIYNLTNTALYDIYVVASNQAGDVFSLPSTNVSVLGTIPTIDRIVKNPGNSITLIFSQSQKGSDQTTYYYSFDGVTVLTNEYSYDRSLTISNLTNPTPYNIYLVARNPAGDLFSSVSPNVTVLGSKPTLVSIKNNVNKSVIVTFKQTQQGTGSSTYYYSLNGRTVITDVSYGDTNTSIIIPNMSITRYSFYIVARNIAGDVFSDVIASRNMMQSVMFGPKRNNVDKYCAYQTCVKEIEYKKIKTSTNDVSITRRMRFAQYVSDSNRNAKSTQKID